MSFLFVCFIYGATECNSELLSFRILKPNNKPPNSFVNVVIQTQTCLCGVCCRHVGVLAHLCVCIWRTEADSEGLPQFCSTLIFESGSLTEPIAHQFV